MKILSFQGILFAVLFYVAIDRALNYKGTVVSQASYKFGGDTIGINFGKNAIFIAVGSLAIVYIMPKLF